MKIEIDDKSLMMIILLEECNLACTHCLRHDEPMEHGYKLSFKQLELCLLDCHSLERISWVHFTGGEPTLWTEKDRSLIDLLLEIAKAGFTPGFTTNGSFFVNYDKCREFFGKYFGSSSMPIRVYFSIDTFHKNFNPTKERAKSLDNIIKCRQELPPAQADLFEINVMSVISKDFNSLLPDGMVRYYQDRGVAFGFLPLLDMGKATAFSHLCPDLSSHNPEDLGAYRPFYKKKNQKRRIEMKNRDSADHINLIGSDYYFARPWRKVAQLGNLPDTIIRAYSNPVGGP